jgi:hypothetical protein
MRLEKNANTYFRPQRLGDGSIGLRQSRYFPSIFSGTGSRHLAGLIDESGASENLQSPIPRIPRKCSQAERHPCLVRAVRTRTRLASFAILTTTFSV